MLAQIELASLHGGPWLLQLFVEGMSIRSIERVSQVHHDTILRLLVLAGQRCEKLMDSTMRDLSCRRVQCDEIWTFVGKKARHVRKGDAAELGDAWIFVAMDADTKLVPVFLIGKRSSENKQTSFAICTSAHRTESS